MSNPLLDKIKRGSGDTTHRVVLAAPEGLGKTTFAGNAPDVLFIAAEDGLTGFDHLARYVPTSLDELHNFLDQLIIDANGFKALAVDTADWMERFIINSVCARDGKANIEEYGYGKGYVLVEQELVRLLQKLDTLRSKQKMWVIVLSHVQIRTFNDPRGESWDRYEMKGHKRLTGILREWADACLFGVYEVFKIKDQKDNRKEKAAGGERIMHTVWSPAWDAKNRLNLPETLPMDWEKFTTAVSENSPAALITKAKALINTAKLDEAAKAKWVKASATFNTLTADKLKAAIEKLTSLQ